MVHRLGIAATVTVCFAALAYLVRGVTPSGAAAGAVMCFALYGGAGPSAFAALLSVFALTWITTRLGYKRKQKLGTAEPPEGRTARQVVANLGVAAACACLYAVSGTKIIFLVALTAALSEAAADTVSSEVGQAVSECARLITTWERVPAGTNGGVSMVGTLAGIGAAALVTVICVLTRLLPARLLWIPLFGSVFGMFADSYFGAWLERRGLIKNDSVNFLSTLVASVTAGVLVSFA
jgi:uncharacterized protein (TIGR00297 family)